MSLHALCLAYEDKVKNYDTEKLRSCSFLKFLYRISRYIDGTSVKNFFIGWSMFLLTIRVNKNQLQL